MTFLRKAEEDSDSLSTRGRAFQSLGAELKKSPEAKLFFGMVFIHTEGETEKTIEEIMVVDSKELALEDTVELCQ